MLIAQCVGDREAEGSWFESHGQNMEGVPVGGEVGVLGVLAPSSTTRTPSEQ